MAEVKEATTDERPPMERVKALRGVGLPVWEAIRATLASLEPRLDADKAIPRFAERHGLNRTAVSGAIYGHRNAAEKIVTALFAELGGESPWEVAELLKAGRRERGTREAETYAAGGEARAAAR